MNKPEFTPGPWEVEEYEDGHKILMGNAIESEGTYDSHCEIEYDHMCYHMNSETADSPGNRQAREAEANAYLIAAAPDMYEALSECFALFALGANAMSRKGINFNEKRGKAREIERKVLSALAKARGESHG